MAAVSCACWCGASCQSREREGEGESRHVSESATPPHVGVADHARGISSQTARGYRTATATTTR
eukprot:1786218-Rhodomonas_salina.2